MSPPISLNAGDPAPEFEAFTSRGDKVCLVEFKGHPVILYFYPKDDTPGCTNEACAFRDHFQEFQQKGAIVLGVSTDSISSHQKFASKFKLPFALVADPDKKIVQAYGVWGQKSFMGRKYLGVHRVTFLIHPDGRIRKIWTKIKPKDHAQEVLAELDSLNSSQLTQLNRGLTPE